jgi:hypothetical protein
VIVRRASRRARHRHCPTKGVRRSQMTGVARSTRLYPSYSSSEKSILFIFKLIKTLTRFLYYHYVT